MDCGIGNGPPLSITAEPRNYNLIFNDICFYIDLNNKSCIMCGVKLFRNVNAKKRSHARGWEKKCKNCINAATRKHRGCHYAVNKGFTNEYDISSFPPQNSKEKGSKKYKKN